jgi:hypothetical protein
MVFDFQSILEAHIGPHARLFLQPSLLREAINNEADRMGSKCFRTLSVGNSEEL